MHKIPVILILLWLSFTGSTQVIFKTIAPQRPVAVGESFPIQYILEDIDKKDEFTPPLFTGFRLVSGPYIYGGSVTGNNGPNPLKNIVFTLVAKKAGRFIIRGATAKVNGRLIKSDDAVILVISKADAFEKVIREGNVQTASEYFLQPGEDPYEKMRRNLFMKVMVDKKSCFVGQPVVATFKLYSRLESKSDIVKNPGFYGFTVQDIINLNDNITTTETIKGKPFDVHTVRSVQLYPLRAGIFTIDAMEVMNKVEFSKSIINRKTEQEIVEGVFENNDRPSNENTVIYESSISTEKITINVRPSPVRNKPDAFSGATGQFSLLAALEKNGLAKNEEGGLILTIRGKGNFTQLSAPVVQWPAGIEGFEPVIKDSLDKTQAPLKGKRAFRFPFIANKAGYYTIPAISFSFFDPDSNIYKTVSVAATEIKISNGKEEVATSSEETNRLAKKRLPSIWWTGSSVLLILAIILIWFIIRRKRQEIKTELPLHEKFAVVSINELLQPVQFSLKADDGRFYSLLQKSIWDHLSRQLELSGSKMNKDDLYKAMKEKKLNEGQCREILDILQQCDAAVFTKAEFADDKHELLNRTKSALEHIKI